MMSVLRKRLMMMPACASLPMSLPVLSSYCRTSRSHFSKEAMMSFVSKSLKRICCNKPVCLVWVRGSYSTVSERHSP